MYLIDLVSHKRMDIVEGSDLKKARELYNSAEYSLRVDREINDQKFLNEFIKFFGDIKSLGFSAYGKGVNYSFLYKMSNLQNLNLHTMYEIDFLYLKKLKNLSLWWNKKMIKNISSLTSLDNIHITEFDEKDLTNLGALTNLKSLSFATAKCKTLKGIGNLTNLKALSLGGLRSLTDISDIKSLQKLKFIEFDICWKMEDFNPVGELKELEVLKIIDCKNLASIQFVERLPKLRQLYTLGTTLINDFNTIPAKNVLIFFGSQNSKYNVAYPEKEVTEGQMTMNSYL